MVTNSFIVESFKFVEGYNNFYSLILSQSVNKTYNIIRYREVAEKVENVYREMSQLLENRYATTKGELLQNEQFQRQYDNILASFFEVEGEYGLKRNLEFSKDETVPETVKPVVVGKRKRESSFDARDVGRLLKDLSKRVDAAVWEALIGQMYLGYIPKLVASICAQSRTVIADPALHNCYFRFRKRRASNPTSAAYWLYYDSRKERFKYDIVVPTKNILGSGSYKKIKLGYRIKIALHPDAGGGKSFSCKKIAFIRLKRAKDDDGEQFKILQTHEKIKRFLEKNGSGSLRLAKLPAIRSYNGKWCRDKMEMVQTFYAGNLYQLNPPSFLGKESDYQLRVDYLKDLFATLARLHEGGLIHRDVRPENILLGPSNEFSRHAYLNDFDLLTDDFLGFLDGYFYWDIAAQNGFVSPMTDIVGGILTAIEIFFPGQPLSHRYYAHDLLRDDNFYKKLAASLDFAPLENKLGKTLGVCGDFSRRIKALESLKEGGRIARRALRDLKILEKITTIAKEVFGMEERLYAKLAISSLCLISGLPAADFDRLRGERAIEKLLKILNGALAKMVNAILISDIYLNKTGNNLKDYLISREVDIRNFRAVVDGLWRLVAEKDQAYSPEVVEKIKRAFTNLRILIIAAEKLISALNVQNGEAGSHPFIRESVTADPQMVSDLQSKEPDKRKRGFKKISAEFIGAEKIVDILKTL